MKFVAEMARILRSYHGNTINSYEPITEYPVLTSIMHTHRPGVLGFSITVKGSHKDITGEEGSKKDSCDEARARPLFSSAGSICNRTHSQLTCKSERSACTDDNL